MENGEKVRSTITGRVYQIEGFKDWIAILRSEDGLSQILTEKGSLKLFYEPAGELEDCEAGVAPFSLSRE